MWEPKDQDAAFDVLVGAYAVNALRAAMGES
jgi:hypothetical protein